MGNTKKINIGDKIKELRIRKKIKQSDLAKVLGMSQQTISLYESNNRQPDYDTLVCLADYFDVTADFILGRSNNSLKKNIITDDSKMESLKKEISLLSQELKTVSRRLETVYEKLEDLSL